ncbi:MAG: polysaccharide biosynthesis/export family protein [Candidatus Acidiferrum sp.]|jgi:polysaccharide export outer membrane protein
MRMNRWFWLMLLLGSLTVPSFAQTAASKPQSDDKTATVKDKLPTDDPNYVIGPDDEVIVTVWKEPDISRTVPVRPDGKISLPLLNDVQAGGLTPMQLTAEITARLAKFISAPQVTVIVSRVTPQRIFVTGEVARAGAYPLTPTMTILEAVSIAGGLTPFAKQSKIYVLRTENGKQSRIPVNYKEVLNGHKPEQNVVLKSGDTVVVP